MATRTRKPDLSKDFKAIARGIGYNAQQAINEYEPKVRAHVYQTKRLAKFWIAVNILALFVYMAAAWVFSDPVTGVIFYLDSKTGLPAYNPLMWIIWAGTLAVALLCAIYYYVIWYRVAALLGVAVVIERVALAIIRGVAHGISGLTFDFIENAIGSKEAFLVPIDKVWRDKQLQKATKKALKIFGSAIATVIFFSLVVLHMPFYIGVTALMMALLAALFLMAAKISWDIPGVWLRVMQHLAFYFAVFVVFWNVVIQPTLHWAMGLFLYDSTKGTYAPEVIPYLPYIHFAAFATIALIFLSWAFSIKREELSRESSDDEGGSSLKVASKKEAKVEVTNVYKQRMNPLVVIVIILIAVGAVHTLLTTPPVPAMIAQWLGVTQASPSSPPAIQSSSAVTILPGSYTNARWDSKLPQLQNDVLVMRERGIITYSFAVDEAPSKGDSVITASLSSAPNGQNLSMSNVQFLINGTAGLPQRVSARMVGQDYSWSIPNVLFKPGQQNTVSFKVEGPDANGLAIHGPIRIAFQE